VERDVSASVVALVLLSAFVHAGWNALLKRERDTEAAAVAYLTVCTATAIAAACVWPGRAFASAHAVYWSLGAGVFEGVYFVALAIALGRAPLGKVYTVSRGGALVVVWPVSVLWLGEQVNAARVAGTVLVAVGLAATGWPQRAQRSASDASGTTWAVVAAVAIAGYHIGYKLALGAGGSPAAVFALSLAIALPMNWVRLADRRRAVRAFRTSPYVVGVAGVLSAASFLAFLGALVRGGAGLVLTLRNTSVVFAQAMAWLIGERPARRQILGALLVAGGAVLLGWP
jgi:drug/metabolite transporter (DMT)-like permease